MIMSLPIIAVTMGDPAGVGPEVCLQLLENPEVREFAIPVIFGDAEILRACSAKSGWLSPRRVIAEEDWEGERASLSEPAVLDLKGFDDTDFVPGMPTAHTGAAAFRYISASIQHALSGSVAAVATAPLNKEALHASGVLYPGHTEIFTEMSGAARSCMLQYSDEVRASFVTVHVGYHEVPNLLTKERILEVIELTADAMRRIRGTEPKLCVLGLNPHAGEHGLFGNFEEERLIAPAVAAAREAGLIIEGPIPPDTAFVPEKRRTVDAFICMYHDQGHIPLKALAFDTAVNTTLGLPIIRTSVDHGTACDIAWQGKARGSSLFEAVRMAAKLARP